MSPNKLASVTSNPTREKVARTKRDAKTRYVVAFTQIDLRLGTLPKFFLVRVLVNLRELVVTEIGARSASVTRMDEIDGCEKAGRS